MKKLLFFFLLVSLQQYAVAQAPTWAWSMASGGGDYSFYNHLITGKTGTDMYILGRYSGTINLGGKSLSGGGLSAFLGKFDGTGTFSNLVANTYGSTYPNGIGRDTNDNIYTAGNIGSNSGLWVDKWNNSVVKQWGTTTSSAGSPAGYVVAPDRFGNVYTAGHYATSFSIGGNPALTAYGGYDMYFAKTNSTGTVLWSIGMGGTGWDRPGAMATDSAGNVYILGSNTAAGTLYSRNSSANNFALTAPTGGSGANLFLAKFDSSGKILWVATAKGGGFNNNDWGEKFGMVIDPYGNLYATGYCTGDVQFGGTSFTSKGAHDVFIAKCLPNGAWEWVKTAGGTSPEGARAIAFDENYDLYIAGFMQSTAAQGGVQFGNSIVLNSVGSNDLFVAKYTNSTGNILWALSAGNTGSEDATGITLDKLNNIYVTGAFGPGSLTLGSTTALSTSATGNIYIGKLNATVPLKLNVTPDASYCAGVSAVLPYTISGTYNAGNVFTAQLSDANGSFVSPVNIGTVTANTSGNINITIPPGTPNGNNYIIRVISSSPVYSSFDFGVRVAINGSLNLSVTPNNPTICTGGNVVLTASGGTSYTWAPGGSLNTTSGATVTATPGGTTTYTVNGLSSGCSGSVTVTVTVNPQLTISVTPTNAAICAGGNIALTASGATTYTWAPSTGLSATTGATVTANPMGTTTYTITGTSSTCSNTTTKVVTVNPLPTISINPATATICNGSNIALTASGGNTYTWAPAASLSASTGTGVTASPTTTTTYTITGTDANNCSNTITKVVTVNALPNVSISPPTATAVCAGSSATLTASGATSYSWAPNSGLSSTTGASVTATPTGTTTYTVTGTDGNSCSKTATKVVTVNPLPTISVTPATPVICDGANVVLTASGGTSYSWAPAATLSAASGASVIANPTTTITYTITGNNGTCSNTTTKTVTVNPLPPVVVIPGTVDMCAGKTATLVASGANSYTWSPATGLSATTGNVVIASPGMTTTYVVTGTDDKNCSKKVNVVVNVYEKPSASLATSGPTTFCQGDDVTMSVGTGANFTYRWQESGNDIVGAIHSIHTVGVSGNYRVIVDGGGGCIDTSKVISVKVNPLPNPVITSVGATLKTGAYKTYQWYYEGQPIPSATAQTYKASQNGFYYVMVADSNGCENISAMYNLTTVSVNDVGIVSADINIYPNPTTNVLYITTPVVVNVMIYSMDGRTVMQQDNAKDIDISSLSNGMYMIRVANREDVAIKVERIIKQ